MGRNPGRPGSLKGNAMPWIILVAAGLMEVLWAFTMKQSQGFTKPVESVITIIAMAVSVWLLAVAMRSLPLGTAYTIWTGIGAVGAFTVGILVLGEAATPLRLVAAAMIVGGLILMKLSGTLH
jgi:quaternary ammonium compound-resistance protein SugE